MQVCAVGADGQVVVWYLRLSAFNQWERLSIVMQAASATREVMYEPSAGTPVPPHCLLILLFSISLLTRKTRKASGKRFRVGGGKKHWARPCSYCACVRDSQRRRSKGYREKGRSWQQEAVGTLFGCGTASANTESNAVEPAAKIAQHLFRGAPNIRQFTYHYWHQSLLTT